MDMSLTLMRIHLSEHRSQWEMIKRPIEITVAWYDRWRFEILSTLFRSGIWSSQMAQSIETNWPRFWTGQRPKKMKRIKSFRSINITANLGSTLSLYGSSSIRTYGLFGGNITKYKKKLIGWAWEHVNDVLGFYNLQICSWHLTPAFVKTTLQSHNPISFWPKSNSAEPIDSVQTLQSRPKANCV